MKKKSILLSLFMILLMLSSCSLDELGKNVLGNYNPNVSNIGAGKTNASDLIANNEGLKNLFDSLNGNSDANLDDIVVVSPLSDKELNDLKINYANDQTSLKELKDKDANLSEADKEGVKGTAEFVNGYLSDIKVEEIEEGPVKDLVSNIKDTLGKIEENPDNAKAGDVIALKYTVTLLDQVANATKDGVEISKEVAGEDEPVSITVTSSDIIDALFGKKNESEEPKFELEDFSKLLETPAGSTIVGSVESYLNIVGSASNLTGDVNISSIINQFLK